MSALENAAVCGIDLIREVEFALDGINGILALNCYPSYASICVSWPAWLKLLEVEAIKAEHASVKRASTAMFCAVHTAEWARRNQADARLTVMAMEPSPEEMTTCPPF